MTMTRSLPISLYALVLLLCIFVVGCASAPEDRGPSKPHHRLGGFQNLPGGLDKPGFGDFLRWQRERLVGDVVPQEADRVPRVEIDLPGLHAQRLGWQMTWLGHSSVHLQVDGLHILIDPALSSRASPFEHFGPKAYNPTPVSLKQLPRIDVVLVSHNHYDHLDERTIRALAAQTGGPPLFIVPLGVDRYLRSWGLTTVLALDWYEMHTVGLPLQQAHRLTIEAVPAHHWSRRTFWDTNETLWAGFRLQTKDLHLLYTGDTGYSTIFKEMARRWSPIDWLLVPIGCYEPRWFMQAQHVNPAEAQKIAQDLGARNALGVHWGVFRLCDEPVEQPIADLKKAQEQLPADATRIQLWSIGESRMLRSDH